MAIHSPEHDVVYSYEAAAKAVPVYLRQLQNKKLTVQLNH